MMISLVKVEHEVLMFSENSSKYNNYGLAGIYTFTTKAFAERGAEKLREKIQHRTFMVRKAVI